MYVNYTTVLGRLKQMANRRYKSCKAK